MKLELLIRDLDDLQVDSESESEAESANEEGEEEIIPEPTDDVVEIR